MCYGHTHKASVCQREHALFLNPGSLSGRHSVTGQTYAIVDLTENGIQAELFQLDGRKITGQFLDGKHT